VVIPRWGSRRYNRVYDKFCTIDIDYVVHGSSTANDSEEILATTLCHELIAKLLKSLWNDIMGFIFKQREIKIYGDNFIRNLMKLPVYLEKKRY